MMRTASVRYNLVFIFLIAIYSIIPPPQVVDDLQSRLRAESRKRAQAEAMIAALLDLCDQNQVEVPPRFAEYLQILYDTISFIIHIK